MVKHCMMQKGEPRSDNVDVGVGEKMGWNEESDESMRGGELNPELGELEQQEPRIHCSATPPIDNHR